MGVIEGNQVVSDNTWESITDAGDAAIKKWIAEQMSGKSCAIVLIGNGTAGRKWISHEIIEAWNAKKGVLGIYIHNLKNLSGAQATKGSDPFSGITVGDDKLSSIVKTYDPPYATSTNVYSHICDNMADWVEDAITIRAKH